MAKITTRERYLRKRPWPLAEPISSERALVCWTVLVPEEQCQRSTVSTGSAEIRMLLTEQRVGSGVAELGIGPVDGPAHEGRLAAWVRFASRQLGL